MTIRSRLINHEVTELLHRLGIHNYRLSDPERAYLHRYVYLSVIKGLHTLGVPVQEQDPLLPESIVRPPLFDRVPPMPPTIQADDILADITEVVETNGHAR
jgi:hypothetical protein